MYSKEDQDLIDKMNVYIKEFTNHIIKDGKVKGWSPVAIQRSIHDSPKRQQLIENLVKFYATRLPLKIMFKEEDDEGG